LAAGPLDETQRQMCRIAADSTATLTQLVDDVLDLSRIEAGQMVLHRAPLDLPVLLGQVVENHRLAAEARGLRLGLDIDERLPRRVLADGLRLRQLLVNVIGNAIKYTPQGEVQVSARRVPPAPGQEGRDRLALVVRDTGIGIAPERQHALFEPFGTAHALAEAPAEGSTGLGLAICKRLVDAMDGRIGLDSVPGRGTVLTIDLPMPDAVPDAAAPGVPSPRAGPAADPQYVQGLPGLLLVDDDVVSRLLMGETLRRQGWQVLEAGSLAEARRALASPEAANLAAIISDHQLPDGQGLAFLRGLAAGSPSADRPRLILCTGSPLDADADTRSLDALLRKPVGSDRLAQTLHQLLSTEAAEG
jgi:CheY-like chemotaxis protein/two-component sensor histidine kinase